jgi:hypothetical protein
MIVEPKSWRPIRSNYFNQQVPSALVATVVNAALLVVALWGHTRAHWLFTWLVSVLAVTLGRYGLLQCCCRNQPPIGEANRWGRRFLAGVGLSAVIWGAAGGCLFPQESESHQSFLMFVLPGMAAGQHALGERLRAEMAAS